MQRPTASLIVCHDASGAIGYKGQLPWSYSLDMKFFTDVTRRGAQGTSVILVGSATMETMPALRGRKVVGISRDEHRQPRHNLQDLAESSWATPEEAIALVAELNRKNIPVYIGGGAKIYAWSLGVFNITEYYVTRICWDHLADTFLDRDTLEVLRGVPTRYQFDMLSFATTNQVVTFHWERPYLDLLHEILKDGKMVHGRNGVTQSVFGRMLRFDLATAFPLLTTKRVFFKGVFEELMFFLRGETDTTILQKKGVNIWEANTSKEFLEKRGLGYPVGDMGPMYGYNWRQFGKDYLGQTQGINGAPVDQFTRVINLLAKDPFTRRAHMTTYNPACVDEGVLEPCHGLSVVFRCDQDRGDTSRDPDSYFVSCHMTQRSADMVCGVPFNIASYALLVHVVCALLNGKQSNRKYLPGELVMSLCDAHIYRQHVDVARRQVMRIPQGDPQLTLPPLQDIDWVMCKMDGAPLTLEDVKLTNYTPHFKLDAQMVA